MSEQQKLLAIIPLFPLVGAILAFVIGRRAKPLAGWIATLAAGCSFGASWHLFSGLGAAAVETKLFNWLTFGMDILSPSFAGDGSQGIINKLVSIDFAFRFDQLTAVMCLVVTGIGTLIHLYSTAYMAEDEGRHRFFSYLNLFLFAMLLLVLGANLLVLFVGWEGVGLCSYLLIGFWFKNVNYAAAGRKAFVVNRIGDAGFLVGSFLALKYFGTLDFVLLQQAISANSGLVAALCTAISLAFFIGATGKSAQVPLFVWLPDAMAGPTPVSALIHAATMVTAGVYLLARMHFVFDLAPLAGAVICVVAILTAFIAAAIAFTQNDIKKVLAYSTVSQLGFMFLAASVGAYWVALFHVVTHAFFKACLFLGAGSVIHGCHHEQDMRHMGGLMSKMPVTFLTYLISTLAIAGIYPFAGYQSKHAILAALEHAHNPYLGEAMHWVLILAKTTAFFTAFYMARSLAMTFFGSYRGHAHPHESPWQMTVPLVVLAGLACVGGVYLEHGLPQYLTPVLGEGILAGAGAHGGGDHGAAGIIESLVGSWVGIAGVVAAVVIYTSISWLPGRVYKLLGPISKLSKNKFFFDEIYAALIVKPLEFFSFILWKGADQALIDGVVNGTGAVVEMGGELSRGTITGQIRHYALLMAFGVVVILVPVVLMILQVW